MRRPLVIALCLTFFTVVVVSRERLSSDTRRVIERAALNEQQAAARYEAYAVKATEEGYVGAAALFRACARAEKIHATRFAELAGSSSNVPADAAFKAEVRSTEDNLRSAVAAETAERDGIYRDAIETAKLHGEDDIAKVFDETRDVETEHANLQTAALRNLSAMKSPHEYYVCTRCGYTTDINLARCPSCLHGQHPEAVR